MPREKHIPDDAQRTSVRLTAEDREAIHWIAKVRRAAKSRRTTTNDVLVDALWYYLEKVEGKSREDIKTMLPTPAPSQVLQSSNVAQMPKFNGKKKR